MTGIAPGEGNLGGSRPKPKPKPKASHKAGWKKPTGKAAPVAPSKGAKEWASKRSVFVPGKTITDAVPAPQKPSGGLLGGVKHQAGKSLHRAERNLERVDDAQSKVTGIHAKTAAKTYIDPFRKDFWPQIGKGDSILSKKQQAERDSFADSVMMFHGIGAAGGLARVPKGVTNPLGTLAKREARAAVSPAMGIVPKGVGGVAKKTPLGPKTLGETVQEATKGAKGVREAQEAGYSVERARRVVKAEEAYRASGGGSEGVAAAMTHLSGELPKIEFGGFKELTPDALDAMVRHVYDNTDLRFFEKLRTSLALQKATKGTVPTTSELRLIEQAFGKATRDMLADPKNISKMDLIKHYALDIWNLPRSVLASFDLSAPFRQGIVAGARHPVIFTKNIAPMVKAFGRDKYALETMEDIASRANVPLYVKAKLAITETHGANVLAREEAFPSAIADYVPGVKASGRAYTVFLNKMRADVFDHMVEVAKAGGKNVEDPAYLDSLGNFVNAATGRGKLPGRAEDAAVFLNSFLFSPRLLASRFNLLNPHYYYSLHPDVRWQAVRASGQLLGGILTFLTLASQIPGWSVGLDPRSANFGKIRIRNTRIDVAAGFLPLLVLYSRIASGQMVSSSSGKKMDMSGKFGDTNRWEVMQRFLEGKMAPTPGLIRDIAKQQTFLGKPVTWKGQWTWKNGVPLPSRDGEIQSLFIPLNIQGAFDTYHTEGSVPAALGTAGLGSIGFGVGSYGDKPATSSSKTASKTKWGKPGSSSRSSSSSSDKSKWKKP